MPQSGAVDLPGRHDISIGPKAGRFTASQEQIVRTAVFQLFETIKESSRKIGPYLLLELLLPGGTLFALALFAYRHQSKVDVYFRLARRTLGRTWARTRAWFAKRASAVRAIAWRQRVAALAISAHRPHRCTRAHVPGYGGTSWRMRPATVGCCPAWPL